MTLAGALTGLNIDLSTNYTATGYGVTGQSIALPAVTNTGAGTYAYKGLTVTGGALVQNTGAGTDTWTGLDITMPNITQTTGTVTSTGLKITGGTVTSGTSYGLIIDANAGNVGIGTTAPAYTLDVNGSIGTGSFNVTGAIFATGLGTGTDTRTVCLVDSTGRFRIKNGVCGTSSLRYKENIENLAYGLNEINQLNPVFYNNKAGIEKSLDGRTKRRIGFIAEEMNNIIPEVVFINESGQPESIDYPNLVSLLTKGVQELDSKVNNLGGSLASLSLTSTGDLEIKQISADKGADLRRYVYSGNLGQPISTNFNQFQLISTTTGEIISRIGAFSELVAAKIKAGLIETENAIVNNTLIAKNAILETAVFKIINSEKITSPIVETNEIKPADKDVVINISDETNETNGSNGRLARLIIKGLEGKTVTTLDAAGNASFSGQIIADSLQINNDATVSGSLASNTLTTNEASVSGKLIAKEVEAGNINDLTKTVFDQRQSLTDQSSSINDIQKLLAEIKNQPLPDTNYYQNIDSSQLNQSESVKSVANSTGSTVLTDLTDLIVTGNSNLYTVSVSNSLLVGTTIIDQNSIISLASELKLSALSTINLFDGAVIIAKDGTITTRGELIAEKGIRTDEIKPLTDNGQVSINNLTTNNLTISDKYLDATSSAAIIAASDNFEKNGLFAPAIETASASAGIAILPENQIEVVIYNNNIKKDSLVYLTPTSSVVSSQLSVVSKESCQTDSTDSTGSNRFNCRPYFKVISNTPLTLPIKFNWLIIN